MKAFLALLGVWMALCPAAGAHRLDEYLQATRLSIDLERVDLEMDLTAGTALATEVFAWIDANRNHEISTVEGEAYARQVLHSVSLSLDGKSIPITLVAARFPPFRDMSLGVGTIRLRATARVPRVEAGDHRISFLNTHRPESSVYLVNALVPANARIHIGDQQRDQAQHGLTVAYKVSPEEPSGRSFALLAGSVIVGRWFLRRRRPLNSSGGSNP